MIYVGPIRDFGEFGRYAAMVSDASDKELEDFAKGIGAKPIWFSPKPFPHYDLNKWMRQDAIRAGAEPVKYPEIEAAATRLRIVKRKAHEAERRAPEVPKP